MIELSDELLVAYVDGQLDRPQAATLTRLVGEDEELLQRVQRLRHTQTRLMENFSHMLRDTDCASLDELLSRDGRAAGSPMAARVAALTASPSAAKWGAVAALLALGGAAGFSAAYYTGTPTERPVKNDARIAPAPAPVIAPERPAPVERQAAPAPAPPAAPAPAAHSGATGATSPTGPSSAQGWTDDLADVHARLSRDPSMAAEGPSHRDLAPYQLASLMGKALPVPDFSAQKLYLSRSQMFHWNGAKLVQLTYAASGRSEPVTLYVMAASTNAPEALAFGGAGEVRAAGWSADGVRYLIAGKLAPEALRALAMVAQLQLNKKS